jgi:hypothetical protein
VEDEAKEVCRVRKERERDEEEEWGEGTTSRGFRTTTGAASGTGFESVPQRQPV